MVLPLKAVKDVPLANHAAAQMRFPAARAGRKIYTRCKWLRGASVAGRRVVREISLMRSWQIWLRRGVM